MRVFKRKRRRARVGGRCRAPAPTWAIAGRRLTFRAEVMPGRGASERTFIVERVNVNGRVELSGLSGQHSEAEFEAAH